MDTYYDFVNFIKKQKDKIRDELIMPEDSKDRALLYPPFAHNFLGPPDAEPVKGLVAATDSSEFVRELYNGKKLILIRAYTWSGSNIHSSFHAEISNVNREHLQVALTALMEHNEHLSILKMLESESPDYVLVDGSIAGRLYKPRNLGYPEYDRFRKEYYSTLEMMLSKAESRNVRIVFVAKSSDSTLFRRYLERTYSLHLDEGKPYTDHYLVKSLARRSGFTIPLFTKSRLGGEDGAEISIITTHVLPSIDDLPLKVEVAGTETGSGEEGPGHLDRDVLNLVFYGYGNLKTHNIWIVNVDRMVKFRTDEIENLYLKTFEREIGINFYETRGERRARLRI
ncbi:DNA double-strand break repair nuclease NurA [Thermoplasmatales archaeon AK]|nr:DNA double-strand break repair nuclease NurA [Thermoplasmatales archaeon AK]